MPERWIPERWMATRPLKGSCPAVAAKGAPRLSWAARVALTPCLVLSALTWAGCTSQSQTSGGAGFAQRKTEATQLIVEEFDPRLVREELLLIQPDFKPPPLPRAGAQNMGDGADPPAPAGEKHPESSRVAPSSIASPDELVYRVQVIALSVETSAARLAAELEMLLGLRVVLEPEGGLFAVRAGELDTPGAAEKLRDRITALKGDYREAFIFKGSRPAEMEVLADAPADSLLDDPWEPLEEPPPELVETDGWRVLIDQFLSLAEAERLKLKAMRRLGRADIFIDFQEPYYKVEVGNYRSSAEAQEAFEQIKRRNYRKALKVRAVVSVLKEEAE